MLWSRDVVSLTTERQWRILNTRVEFDLFLSSVWLRKCGYGPRCTCVLCAPSTSLISSPNAQTISLRGAESRQVETVSHCLSDMDLFRASRIGPAWIISVPCGSLWAHWTTHHWGWTSSRTDLGLGCSFMLFHLRTPPPPLLLCIYCNPIWYSAAGCLPSPVELSVVYYNYELYIEVCI